MKVGMNVTIKLSAIDQARKFKSNRGEEFYDFTTFVDLDNKDQYDQNGFLTHKKKSKDEDYKSPIVGNVSVFWKDGEIVQGGTQAPQAPAGDFDNDSDIPFSNYETKLWV